jgi:hypothetical protein
METILIGEYIVPEGLLEWRWAVTVKSSMVNWHRYIRTKCE